MKQRLQKILEDSISAQKQAFESNFEAVDKLVAAMIKAFESGHRVFFCGNGGSAADSQHIAAEFIGRFQKERKALPAIALTTDTSVLTCLANDYGYDVVFSRQLEGLAHPGDILVGLSTSGKSVNVLKAFEKARQMRVLTVALTGHDGGPMGKMADISIIVPSKVTARIQEAHIILAHAICELVEEHFAA
jgi:D-sedoheptulose 7-phosphate isomerase